MDKIVAESPDLKKLEKQFKKQLNDIEIEKEMLEVQLKNKNKELKQLNMQYRDKEVLKPLFFTMTILNQSYQISKVNINHLFKEHFDKLEQEKRSLERQLELEAIKSYNLIREVDNLRLAKKKLEIYIDHIEMKE